MWFVGLRFQCPRCRVQGQVSGPSVQSAEFVVHVPAAKVAGPKVESPGLSSKVQIPESGFQASESKVESKVPSNWHAGTWRQRPGSLLRRPGFRLEGQGSGEGRSLRGRLASLQPAIQVFYRQIMVPQRL